MFRKLISERTRAPVMQNRHLRRLKAVPLVLEYEDAMLRHAPATGLSRKDMDAILDYFCSVGHLQSIFFLWRPLLPDPKNDSVLELAVAAGCQTVVTFNLRDFRGATGLEVSAQRPGELLKVLRSAPRRG